MNFHYLLYNIQIIFFFLVELSFSYIYNRLLSFVNCLYKGLPKFKISEQKEYTIFFGIIKIEIDSMDFFHIPQACLKL